MMPSRLPRITARPATGAPRYPATAFDDVRGQQALAYALGDVSQVAETIAIADYSAKTSLAMSQASADLAKVRDELDMRQDYETLDQEYTDARTQILAKYREGLRGRFADAFDQQMFEVGERYGLDVHQSARDKQLRGIRANTDLSVQNLVNQAGAEKDPAQRKALMESAHAAVESSGIAYNAEERANLHQNINKQIELATWERRIRETPEIAHTLLKKGQGDLSPIEREALINRAESEIEHQAAIRRAEEAAARTARHEWEQARFDGLVRDIYANPVATLKALPPDLPGSQRITLHNIANTIAQGKRVDLDEAYYVQMTQMRDNDFQAFKKVVLDPAKLPEPIWRDLVQKQHAEPTPEGATFANKFALRMTELGYDPNDQGHAADIAKMQVYAETEMARMQQETGKALTPIQIQQAIDLATLGARSEFGRDPEAMALRNLKPGEFPEIEGVPAEIVPLIVDQLLRRNERVTEETIQRFYVEARNAGVLP
jgi:hypothetical protein